MVGIEEHQWCVEAEQQQSRKSLSIHMGRALCFIKRITASATAIKIPLIAPRVTTPRDVIKDRTNSLQSSVQRRFRLARSSRE